MFHNDSGFLRNSRFRYYTARAMVYSANAAKFFAIPNSTKPTALWSYMDGFRVVNPKILIEPRSWVQVVCYLSLLLSCWTILAESACRESTLGIQYASIEGVAPHLNQLDVHTSYNSKSSPVLIFIHGGSWAFGDKSLEQSNKLSFLCSLGLTVVSVNYRLSSINIQHPDHVSDVATAISWVNEHITRYGGNPKSIFLMGHSAGAHLASLVALDPLWLGGVGLDSSSLSGVILIDTATLDLVETMQSLQDTPSSFYHNAFGPSMETWIDASPMHQIDVDELYPPMLILVASPVLMPMQDQLNTLRKRKWQSVNDFAKRLKAGGTQVHLVNAMQYKSHRSIDRDLGKPSDRLSLEVAAFIEHYESMRTGRIPVSTLRSVEVLSVKGKEWEEARRELGDYSADVLLRFRDSDEDGQIELSELRKEEQSYMPQWDLDHDGKISREDIISGYEKLRAE